MPAAKTIAAVERARQEVNGLKAHVSQLLRSEIPADQNVARSLAKHTQQAEALVEKAESTVKRVKGYSRVPPRPTASVPPSLRAKRSLSVLLSGLDADDILLDVKGPQAGRTVKKEKLVEGTAEEKIRSPKWKGPFLSAAGKPTATPMREEDFTTTLGKVHKETGLAVLRTAKGDGAVFFECPNVFRAAIWFKEADVPCDPKSVAEAPSANYIVPEHIAVFGVDETNPSRWACSRYAVFKVITERANAAVRYFMAREKTGEEAFLALGKWLARHKTLFSAKCEDRRLAFDASRGIFLPACIYPFEGHGPPRFTRGSIPLRSNSTYATQPTVRVPSGSHAPGSQPQTSHAAGSGTGGATAASANATAPGAADPATGAGRGAPPVHPNVAGGGRGDHRNASSRGR